MWTKDTLRDSRTNMYSCILYRLCFVVGISNVLNCVICCQTKELKSRMRMESFELEPGFDSWYSLLKTDFKKVDFSFSSLMFKVNIMVSCL